MTRAMSVIYWICTIFCLKFIDGNVDEPFRKHQSLHVTAQIGNLSNVAPNTNLSFLS
jgi:hypothetical protein